jgi:toll-like receptor 13
MQSIATSRKVVLVISENFIQSHWCLWELHLAQHSLLEDKRNGLVLVVVGKLKLNQCPPTLRFLMKTRIYLEWDLDPSKQRVFWERLRDALAPSSLLKSISLPDAG